MTTIYHNPRCSKSRGALALLRARGVEPEVVNYLDNPPDAPALTAIIAMLGGSIRDVIRRGDALYGELGLADEGLCEAALIDVVVANPRLLERPIVVHRGRAVVGRPPENVLAIL